MLCVYDGGCEARRVLGVRIRDDQGETSSECAMRVE